MHRAIMGSMALAAALMAAPAIAQDHGSQQEHGQNQSRYGPTGGGQEDQQGLQGQGTQHARVGQPAPAIVLTDLNNVPYPLPAYRGKVVVLEWIDPMSDQWKQEHQQNGELKRRIERYKSQGVMWFGVCSFQEQGGTMQNQPGATHGGTAGQTGHMGQSGQSGQSGQGGQYGQSGQSGQVGPSGQAGQGQLVQPLHMSQQQAREACLRIKNELNIDFPILLDPDARFGREFGVSQYPFAAVIDPRGTVAFAGPIQATAGPGGQVAGLEEFDRTINDAIMNRSLPAGAPRDQQQPQPPDQNRYPQGGGQQTPGGHTGGTTGGTSGTGGSTGGTGGSTGGQAPR